LEKREILITIVTFITGLHNKPQGCGASVASAAGPFTIKKRAVCGAVIELSNTDRKFRKSQLPVILTLQNKNVSN
jgi:hypothetical protein